MVQLMCMWILCYSMAKLYLETTVCLVKKKMSAPGATLSQASINLCCVSYIVSLRTNTSSMNLRCERQIWCEILPVSYEQYSIGLIDFNGMSSHLGFIYIYIYIHIQNKGYTNIWMFLKWCNPKDMKANLHIL